VIEHPRIGFLSQQFFLSSICSMYQFSSSFTFSCLTIVSSILTNSSCLLHRSLCHGPSIMLQLAVVACCPRFKPATLPYFETGHLTPTTPSPSSPQRASPLTSQLYLRTSTRKAPFSRSHLTYTALRRTLSPFSIRPSKPLSAHGSLTPRLHPPTTCLDLGSSPPTTLTHTKPQST
jgi:hypothetical protein